MPSTSSTQPAVEPKHWDELPKTASKPGLSQSAFRGDGVLLVVSEMAADYPVNLHSHPFEQITHILEGEVNFHVGGKVVPGRPGSIVRFPPNVLHSTAPAGGKPVRIMDVYAPPRQDYLAMASHQAAEFGES